MHTPQELFARMEENKADKSYDVAISYLEVCLLLMEVFVWTAATSMLNPLYPCKTVYGVQTPTHVIVPW